MEKHLLKRFSWELTLRCNMRCKHCGSSCAEAAADELTTEEALDVVNQLAELGAQRGDLLGGEPFMRSDWAVIAKALASRNIVVSIISNGYFIDRVVAKQIADSGVSLVSLSLEGPQEIHDRIRMPGSYQKCMEAYRYLQEVGVATSCNTTVMTNTLSGLPHLRKELEACGVQTWQIQPSLPMGRMKNMREKILTADQIQGLIDFVLETNEQGKIYTVLAENLGYYSNKLQRALQLAHRTDSPVQWKGCHAGIDTLGILSNGDVNGCVSIRFPGFTEGNVREMSLREIWDGPDSFLWRRQMRPEQLGGVCKTCRYAGYCLGGCTCTKLSICGNLYSEYPYCIYAAHLKQTP